MNLLFWAVLTKFSSSGHFQEVVLGRVGGATQETIADTVLKFNPSLRNVKMGAQESELKIKKKWAGTRTCNHRLVPRPMLLSHYWGLRTFGNTFIH